MKRSGFLKRKTPLRSYTPLQASKLRFKGVSTTKQLKTRIQELLREIVILRDKGCILRFKRNCGGEIGQAVLQADHLITRSNSATYADSRLVVCVCRSCHGWKSLGSNLRKAQYDSMVKEILPRERVELWEKCEQDSWRPNPKRTYDWKLSIIQLEQELKKLKELT